MAKRKRTRSRKKKRNRPNIPQETLNRARQGDVHEGASGAPETPDTSEPEAAEDTGLAKADEQIQLENAQQAPSPAQYYEQMRAERYERRAAAAARRKRSRNKKGSDVSPDAVANLLAHPTKEVSEEELKMQYNYVLTDLRNMGILAAVLFTALIGLGVWQTL